MTTSISCSSACSASACRVSFCCCARVPRAPTCDCTPRQRWGISIFYFVLVSDLAYFATTMFDNLPRLVRENMGD